MLVRNFKHNRQLRISALLKQKLKNDEQALWRENKR
jgi:hypothetical protein